jgi:hypothetical protein
MTYEDPTLIGERVAAGAAWLDQHAAPDWVEDVNLERLDMNHRRRCVLGQIYGDYFSAGDVALPSRSELYGFNVSRPYDDDVFAQLDAEWTRLIRERRAATDGGWPASQALTDPPDTVPPTAPWQARHIPDLLTPLVEPAPIPDPALRGDRP